jgi:hypothetical protein
MPKGRQAEEKKNQRELAESIRGSTMSTGRSAVWAPTAANINKRAAIKIFNRLIFKFPVDNTNVRGRLRQKLTPWPLVLCLL